MKKTQKAQKKITDLSVFCQIFLKCMRSSCLNKCLNILNLFYRNISVDSGRDTSTQHCLLSMLGKRKSAIDNKKMFGALLTDLSKAFDCLSHDLLIAKLSAYGFSIAALRLVQNNLSNGKQRTKINSDFSSWEETLFGAPQESILGPLLFNIFLCDLFFIINETDFSSYVDNNTPYVVGNNIEDVIIKLQNASLTLFQWFYDNQMKANPDKCHFICTTDEKVNITV